MLKISEVLEVKGNVLYTATPDTPLSKAVEIMSEVNVGCLIVMEHNQLVGMVSFIHVMNFLTKNNGVVGDTLVRTVMDDAPFSISPNTSVDEVQRLMLEQKIRYMPIMDGPNLLGVISFADMARAMLSAHQFENKMLKAYISSWPDNEDKDKANV